MQKITKYINQTIKYLWRLANTYCSLIIPVDDHDEGISIISRTRIIILSVALFIFIISLRLLYVVSRDVYKHHTYTRHEKNYPFKRLDILDRNGNILAKNIVIYDLYLQPSKITNYNETIDKINKVLPNTIKDKKTLIEKLDQRKDTYKTIFIKKGLTFQQQQELLSEDIEGLVFEEQEKRFYTTPASNSIIGYCPQQDKCVSGLEKSMNTYLKTTINKPLELSIDNGVQTILAEILQKTMEATMAKGAVGIIMKVKTGEVISAVSLPSCDFNDYSSCDNSSLFNRYSFGIYELGSVFKLIMAATALQSGISPYKEYKRETYKMDDFTIHDIDNKEEKGGTLNLIDTVRISSNVGCAKIMEDISLVQQYKTMKQLGMLDKLQTELPELGRPIYPKHWSFVNGVTITYGYGIAVSPLHYVSAIASLLNNAPVRPTFLKTDEVQDSNLHFFDHDQSETFRDIMRQVINSGGGRGAYIDEYDIGGKTGTAVQQTNGRYNYNDVILSFVAAMPMNNPEYVFYIMLEKPYVDNTNSTYMRASILGRTMGKIISTIGPILNIRPIGR